MNPSEESIEIHASLYRAGTSKGVFLREQDLPKDQAIRDQLILAIFGSPDPRQIDGLGGADVLTSKLAIVGPATVPDADVDFIFGQVDIKTAYISYSGICGNISSGVANFALDEGMVKPVEPITKVRVYSRNTDQYYTIEVPVKNGKPVATGDYAVPGVPHTGAKLSIDMAGTVGSFRQGLLPTGNAKDVFDIPGIGKLEGSLVDVVNPCLFIRAKDIGLKGTEVLDSDFPEGKLDEIEHIRKKVFDVLGKPYDGKDAVPFVALVSEPQDHISHLNGKLIPKEDSDFLSRVYFRNAIHKTYPGSMTCCTGSAAVIPGTVLYEIRGERAEEGVKIGHPGGVIEVEAVCDSTSGKPEIKKICYGRTARRIMVGTCFVPASWLDE